MKRWILPLLCMMLTVLICLPVCSAAASGMEIKPLEEDDGSLYGYYVPEADVILFLPLSVDTEILDQEKGKMALQLVHPDFPQTSFIFFAIQDESLKGKTLATLSEDGIHTVLDDISSNAGALTYERMDGFLPGVTVLRVKEGTIDSYVEHLLALRDGWVLNMMAGKMGSQSSLTKEEIKYQEEVMSSVLDDGSSMPRMSSYTLPDSDISVTAPDTMYLRLVNDEPDYKVLYLSPKMQGTALYVLQLMAVKDDKYQGVTVLDLDDKTKEAALVYPTFASSYTKDSLRTLAKFEGDIPAFAYDSDEENKHLLAIRDGWALYASIYPLAEFIDPDWVGKMQNAVMHQWLGGKEPLPEWLPATLITWEGNILHFPLQSRVIDITIPEGYGVDVLNESSQERNVYLYALDGSPRYFNIDSSALPQITGDATMDLVYSPAELDQLCDNVSQTVNGLGVTADSKFLMDGPAGVAAIHTTTKEKTFEKYFWMMDSYVMTCSFATEEGTITEEESALLANLMRR